MNEWMFYKEEREEHRWQLGKYAHEHTYVSAWATLKDFDTQAYQQHPTLRFISEQCDNLNLVEDRKGLFCNHCCHYHAHFKLKGLVRVYQPLPQKGYDTPEQTFLNPGKYRSDWTGNEDCFDNPYPDVPDRLDYPNVDLTPGDDFWQRVAKHVSRYGLKVDR